MNLIIIGVFASNYDFWDLSIDTFFRESILSMIPMFVGIQIFSLTLTRSETAHTEHI